MCVFVNIRNVEEEGVRLKGEATVEAFKLHSKDELIRVKDPVKYDLQVTKTGQELFVQADVAVELECVCARCLKSFSQTQELLGWECQLSLTGENAVSVENDCVDLTPFLREDIFLLFPQHPLCSPECVGLLQEYDRRAGKPSGAHPGEPSNSTWADLNKLDL